MTTFWRQYKTRFAAVNRLKNDCLDSDWLRSSPSLGVLLLAVLVCCSPTCNAQLAVLSQLPPLDPSIRSIIFSPAGGHDPLSPGVIPSLCTTRDTVILYDDVYCFLAAIDRAGYRPAVNLSSVSGGEIIFCRQVLNMLNLTGHTFLVTQDFNLTEECVKAGQARGVEHVLIVHGGTGGMWSDEMIGKAHTVRPPFREGCMIQLTLWQDDRPYFLWPGDLKYYVLSFPSRYNSHVLMPKPAHCPTMKSFRAVPLPPYGVMFEKYKTLAWKLNWTNPFSHNATFWKEVFRRVHIVVLDCSDALALKMQWGTNYREYVTCWKDSPLSQEYRYQDLMFGARFFLGLGATYISPTPVDLNYCRTPIIMPPYQHHFIHRYARPGEYFPVLSSDAVLQAVDFILANCSTSFTQGPNGVTKTNTCFHDPPSLDGPMDETLLTENFYSLMHSRKVLCYNHRTKLMPPQSPKPPSPPNLWWW